MTTNGMLAHSCGWGMHDWGGGWMWLGASAMAVVWIAAIGLVVWLVVRSGRGKSGSAGSARGILDERLARGEITTEEHRERSELLQ